MYNFPNSLWLKYMSIIFTHIWIIAVNVCKFTIKSHIDYLAAFKKKRLYFNNYFTYSNKQKRIKKKNRISKAHLIFFIQVSYNFTYSYFIFAYLYLHITKNLLYTIHRKKNRDDFCKLIYVPKRHHFLHWIYCLLAFTSEDWHPNNYPVLNSNPTLYCKVCSALAKYLPQLRFRLCLNTHFTWMKWH